MKIFVPPIKSQGIMTKLVEWIKSNESRITSNQKEYYPPKQLSLKLEEKAGKKSR